MLQQTPGTPEWLEDRLLSSLDKNLSAEEARFAHYQHHHQPGGPKHESPKAFHRCEAVQQLPTTPPPRRDTLVFKREVSEKIMALFNTPQWWGIHWVDGSVSHRQWEQQLESLYLHDRLQSEVAKGYASVGKSWSAQVTNVETKHRDGGGSSSDTVGTKDDGDGAFAQVAKLFSRVVMLREVHRGLVATNKSDHGTISVQAAVDLVQQCRNAASAEAQAQILCGFIGDGYPVATLLSQLAAAWERINSSVNKWMKRVVDVIDYQRLATLQGASGGVYSSVRSTCVLDGAVAHVVKADLVTALEPLLCQALSTTADTATVLRLVDPMGRELVSRQIVPTFSVPRTGSIDNRLAAIIDQKISALVDPFDRPFKQWIPSEVAVDLQGNVRFLTYISNVFPRANRGLYRTIEAIATAFVPLFEKLVSDLSDPTQCRGFWNEKTKKDTNKGTAGHPQAAGAFSLRCRVIQMAVEIVQIDLNPEKPRYSGDDWRCNMTKQQPVDFKPDSVATGVYFARADNVTRPRISYRHVGTPAPPLNFVDGYADRCLVFWNELEHKMEPCAIRRVEIRFCAVSQTALDRS